MRLLKTYSSFKPKAPPLQDDPEDPEDPALPLLGTNMYGQGECECESLTSASDSELEDSETRCLQHDSSQDHKGPRVVESIAYGRVRKARSLRSKLSVKAVGRRKAYRNRALLVVFVLLAFAGIAAMFASLMLKQLRELLHTYNNTELTSPSS